MVAEVQRLDDRAKEERLKQVRWTWWWLEREVEGACVQGPPGAGACCDCRHGKGRAVLRSLPRSHLTNARWLLAFPLGVRR